MNSFTKQEWFIIYTYLKTVFDRVSKHDFGDLKIKIELQNYPPRIGVTIDTDHEVTSPEILNSAKNFMGLLSNDPILFLGRPGIDDYKGQVKIPRRTLKNQIAFTVSPLYDNIIEKIENIETKKDVEHPLDRMEFVSE